MEVRSAGPRPGSPADQLVAPSLWRSRNFSALWAANTASQIGTRISVVAIPLFAVGTLAATPWDMGLLSAVQNIGVLLVGLPAGAWIDRIRRRRLMLTMDLVRALALAAIPMATWTGHADLALLFAVGFITTVAGTFFDIAQQTYVPTLAGPQRVVEANAKIQASVSVSVAAGPGAGGALVSAIGAANSIVVTCASFLASFAMLRRIRSDEPAPESAERDLIAEIKEGLGYVMRDGALRAIAFTTATANLFTVMISSLLVIFLVRTIGLNAFEVGLILASSGIGGALGALTVRRWTARLGPDRTIWMSLLVTQPFGLLLPLADRGWQVGLVALGWLVLGYGGTVYNITQVSYRQTACPARLLGRVQASNRFFAWGTLPLGGLLAGMLGSALGMRGAILIGALGILTATGWLLASPLRSSPAPAVR